MNKIERFTENLKQVYDSVEGVPASHQEMRAEAIECLLGQAWITEDIAACLRVTPGTNDIKTLIGLILVDLTKIKNLKPWLGLVDILASCCDKLFLIQTEQEAIFRTQIEAVIHKVSMLESEIAADFTSDNLLAEAAELQGKLALLQEQNASLQQELDKYQETSSEWRELAEQLVNSQKKQTEVDRKLLYVRQAQNLNKLSAPGRLKLTHSVAQRRSVEEITRSEAMTLLMNELAHSLDRSEVILKIRHRLTREIRDAAGAIAQLDPIH